MIALQRYEVTFKDCAPVHEDIGFAFAISQCGHLMSLTIDSEPIRHEGHLVVFERPVPVRMLFGVRSAMIDSILLVDVIEYDTESGTIYSKGVNHDRAD